MYTATKKSPTVCRGWLRTTIFRKTDWDSGINSLVRSFLLKVSQVQLYVTKIYIFVVKKSVKNLSETVQYLVLRAMDQAVWKSSGNTLPRYLFTFGMNLPLCFIYNPLLMFLMYLSRPVSHLMGHQQGGWHRNTCSFVPHLLTYQG